MSKKIMVSLDQLRQTTNVRVSLDQERVEWFVNILQAGGETEPGLITDDFQIIDGRTRLAAYEICKRTEMPMIKKGMLSKEEIIFLATEANFGGPKPPTTSDMNFTIVLLLKSGVKRKAIVERFSQFIPSKFVSKMIDDAGKQIVSESMRKARLAVSKGTSIQAAAKEFDVNEIALEKAISGIDTDGPKPSHDEVSQMKSGIKQETKGYVRSVVSYRGARFTKFVGDGVFSPKEIESMKHFLELERDKVVNNYNNLLTRIENAQQQGN